jgi:hypothetical protein
MLVMLRAVWRKAWQATPTVEKGLSQNGYGSHTELWPECEQAQNLQHPRLKKHAIELKANVWLMMSYRALVKTMQFLGNSPSTERW